MSTESTKKSSSEGGSRRTKSQKNSENKTAKKVGFMRRLLPILCKLTIVGIVLLVFIIGYYYLQVRSSRLAAAEKWVTPAVVYSRPMELTVDQNITYEQLLYELQLLKYHQVKNPSKPGEYGISANKSKMVIIRRAFDFSSGREDSKPLLLSFTDAKLSRIQAADTQDDIDYVLLDPVLLERLRKSGEEDRIIISRADIPDELIKTLVYVEDRDFYSHFGVNPWAIIRAMVVNIKAGKFKQGGSTITQQLVKNYFLTKEKTFDRKIRELFMSIIVDANFSKDEILEMYGNEIFLGHGTQDIYGFGLASYFYFGVPVNELTWDKAALLVGMIKGPSYYDPRKHPDRALERRNLVLKLMNQAGEIDEKQLAYYTSRPLGIVDKNNFSNISVPGYIGLLKDELSEKLGSDYTKINNLVIHTSLDPQVQLAANKSVLEVLGGLNKGRTKKLETAMVVSNWRTSDVLAIVGSSDPSFPGLNRVTKARRQIGSLVKPAAYLTSFDKGWHLGTMVHDSEVTVKLKNGQLWKPKNFDHKFLGWIPLYKGFANSRNVPMVRVGMDTGVENVVDTLHKLGIKQTIQPVPSVLLGSISLTPFEVNQMYKTIATEGLYKPLSAVRAVIANGEIIYDRNSILDGKQVVDPRNAYLAIYGMTVVATEGTARILNKYNKVLAGKTGTSNDSKDSWFTGFDNNELVTVWIGYDDNTNTKLTGSSGALKVYDKFASLRGVKSLEIAKPDGIEYVHFNFEQGRSYIMDKESCTNYDLYTELPVRTDMIFSSQVKDCRSFFEDVKDEVGNFFNNLFN